MFSQPPKTGTERIFNVQALRDHLEFPSEFGLEISNEQKLTAKKLILWTLKKDPAQRPAVDEILQSENIPLVDFEAVEFQVIYYFIKTLNIFFGANF